MALPLEGVQVLDFTIAQQGPYASMLLGDLGADVIKVESPEGDIMRGGDGAYRGGERLKFLQFNRNKWGIVIDLKTREGQEIIGELARRADVLLENFRPGTAKRLGIGYATISEINPRIIYCSASGYGSQGPYRHKPAFDLIAQALGGLISLNGEPDGGPVPTGAAIVDTAGGILAAFGLLVALFHRERTGVGQKVEVSLLEAVIALQSWEAAEYLNTGVPPRRAGRGHGFASQLYGVFETQDGYLGVAGAWGKRWAKFCRALALDELIDDPRFATDAERLRHEELILP